MLFGFWLRLIWWFLFFIVINRLLLVFSGVAWCGVLYGWFCCETLVCLFWLLCLLHVNSVVWFFICVCGFVYCLLSWFGCGFVYCCVLWFVVWLCLRDFVVCWWWIDCWLTVIVCYAVRFAFGIVMLFGILVCNCLLLWFNVVQLVLAGVANFWCGFCFDCCFKCNVIWVFVLFWICVFDFWLGYLVGCSRMVLVGLFGLLFWCLLIVCFLTFICCYVLVWLFWLVVYVWWFGCCCWLFVCCVDYVVLIIVVIRMFVIALIVLLLWLYGLFVVLN